MDDIHSIETKSAWDISTPQKPKFPSLDKNISVDVAIIGGGITGITAALELTKKGREVVVLEAHTLASGTTGYSTGNLYVPVQPLYKTILSNFDSETVSLIAKSRQSAIDYIEQTINENHIDCHFARRPWFIYTNKEENIELLEKEISVLNNAGIMIQWTDELDLPVNFKKAAVLQNQARFHPYKYTIGLAKILQKNNCQLYEHTHVISLEESNNKCLLKTDFATVSAKKVVMATHLPKGINSVQLFEAPYRSYVVAAQLKNDKYPIGNYWDLDEPAYVTSSHQLQSDAPGKLDTLMIAGSHHKTGQPNSANHFKKIEKYLEEHYEVNTIGHKWSAQHYQSADKIPYIGLANRSSKNIYMATGFFADGLTYGTIAALLLSDLLSGKENQLALIFDPHRLKLLASTASVIKENTNVFYQYLRDYPSNVDAKDFQAIHKGQGKTLESKGEKYAVYRDEQNKLHIVSAVCTHMKCIVAWNKEEKTWDCPCHGSRFTTDGVVIEGPAFDNLKKFENL